MNRDETGYRRDISDVTRDFACSCLSDSGYDYFLMAVYLPEDVVKSEAMLAVISSGLLLLFGKMR